MADVKIIDIDNEQWNIKDQVARDKIATLEESFNSLTVYSTNEVKTGKKWINGKDIYRKVVDFPFSSNTLVTVNVVPNLGANYQVANLSESYVYNPSTFGCRQPWFDNINAQTGIYVSEGILRFITSHMEGRASIVIEYTKP